MSDSALQPARLKTCLVIPTLNEEATIGDVVRETRSFVDEVL
ncbi:MAG: hypothetical protein K0Q72_4006, partial [Armatimonadetes bacterium]|nr:hypothetical protein [Armatimonadota bacterium]